jgi:transcriptional regulator with XRE-family HTH domain
MSSTIEPGALYTVVDVVIIDVVTLAERIKTARDALGMTQAELADACGISDKSVSAWEKSRSMSVAAPHLFKLARVLKVDPEWISTGEGGPLDTQGQILAKLHDLPEEQKVAFLALLDTFTKK